MENNSKLYGYRVESNTYTDVTRERDPNDEWSGEDTSSHTEVLGLVPAQTYSDLAVPFKCKPNTEYFLVYGVYSTGDSFSHDDGRTMFVDLFETFEKAQELAQGLKKHYSDNKEEYSGKCTYTHYYKNEAGKACEVYVPWLGYFESLSEVVVKRVRLLCNHDDGEYEETVDTSPRISYR